MVLSKTNIDLIKRAINELDWEKVFSNIDVDNTVYIFKKTIINILCDFIPHDSGKEKHFQLFPSK